jgi:hypothetical protein
VNVQPKGVTRLASDAWTGQVVPFALFERQAEAAGQDDPDLAVLADDERHVRASHSARRGHPAFTHFRSSSARHNVDRPIRTGCGIRPAESHDLQVRSDLPHITAACLADTKSCSTVTSTGRLVSAWRSCGIVERISGRRPSWAVGLFDNELHTAHLPLTVVQVM